MRCELARKELECGAGGPELREHLAACPACAAAAAGPARVEALLNRAARSLPAPPTDLWERLQARLGATLPCTAARDWLAPAAEGALDPALRRELEGHLAGCAECAAAALAEERAVAALHRARCAPAPDLWPAFAARLAAGEQQRARRWRFAPLLAPGLAAAACLALWVRGPLPAPAPRPGVAAPRLAAVPSPTPAAGRAHRDAAAGVVLPAAEHRPPDRAARNHRRRPRPGPHRAFRSTNPDRRRAAPVPAPALAADVASVAPTIVFAALPASGDGSGYRAARQALVPEVVQVARLLAEMDSALNYPFQEAPPDDPAP